MQFSKDYLGPGFGFLTKAIEYDKWVHFAGSAAGVLMFLWVYRHVINGAPTDDFLLQLSMLSAFVMGLGLEVTQGQDSNSDGFSFLDLIANGLGILLVWVVR